MPSAAAKCTRRLSRARPVSRWVAASLRPSPSATSTSTTGADQRCVLRPRDLVDDGDEPLVALADDVRRHLVGHRGGRRAGPDGVLEGERRGEPRRAHDLERLREVVLGLAGEADDDVGRDRGVGHRRADAVDDAEVLLAAVRAPHRAQHPVGAGLQRHVQLVHHVRRLGHRGDHVVGEVAPGAAR